MSESLAGIRILVVEDEFLVAAFVEDLLIELDAVVVGPAYRVDEGISLARDERIDAALLDVNLNGRRSDPIADILEARGIPYILATGYGESGTSSAAPVLGKPYTLEKLTAALAALPSALVRDR